ncbi:MAG: DsrE/DsrF/DrsH-like family protein [Chloroflexota bacterium]|nr:DsrE/DsrF/DrsH-like family protein [Chloroflexota bacterium]
MSQTADRMSLIVFSGTVDKLMAASILATGAAAMGLEVELFLTTWGMMAFRKDDYKTNTRVSKDFEEYGPVMMEAMQTKKAPSWMENLLGAKEIGDLKVYACSMTMELFGLHLSDLEPIVDDVTGVAAFVERAKEGRITLFI